MKYCAEYINAYHAGYGTYVFEQRRAKWFPRQLSLHEFRINTLEFEMCLEDNERRIYIHIPLENTSLQRNMKIYLLQGGKIGWSLGKLKKDPWI